MFKKTLALSLAVGLMISANAGSALAFDDLDQAAGAAKIDSLQQRGIVSGMDDKHFAPQGEVTYAQAIGMIVKGFGLNIDNLRFFKKPEASDYFKSVPNDAWYASSFMIAQLNGLPLDPAVDPNAVMTREQYADLLVKAVMATGDYALTKPFIIVADQQDVDAAYANSIQTILIMKVASLDAAHKFEPKKAMTRGAAAVWLHDAIRFVEDRKKAMPGKQTPETAGDVTWTTEKINDEVNKVVLSWGQKGSPGFRIAVAGIVFHDADKTAAIEYTLAYPDPDKSYAAVITEPKAAAYLPAGYKPVPVHVQSVPAPDNGK